MSDAVPAGADPPDPETSAAGDGTEKPSRTLHLAKWSTRFGAWLIDVIIVGAIVGAVGSALAVVPGIGSNAGLGIEGAGLFLYWTFFESRSGQSPGKMVLNLRVVDVEGDPIDLEAAAIQSAGKAFLLPIDCLVGWIFMADEQVRLFNKVSDTIVVIDEEGTDPPEGVEYVVGDG